MRKSSCSATKHTYSARIIISPGSSTRLAPPPPPRRPRTVQFAVMFIYLRTPRGNSNNTRYLYVCVFFRRGRRTTRRRSNLQFKRFPASKVRRVELHENGKSAASFVFFSFRTQALFSYSHFLFFFLSFLSLYLSLSFSLFYLSFSLSISLYLFLFLAYSRFFISINVNSQLPFARPRPSSSLIVDWPRKFAIHLASRAPFSTTDDRSACRGVDIFVTVETWLMVGPIRAKTLFTDDQPPLWRATTHHSNDRIGRSVVRSIDRTNDQLRMIDESKKKIRKEQPPSHPSVCATSATTRMHCYCYIPPPSRLSSQPARLLPISSR